jgi:chromosome segregation ATPase
MMNTMSRPNNLSIIKGNPKAVPEDIQRMGLDAVQVIWQTSQSIAQQEIETVKTQYEQYKIGIMQQRQDALDQVDQIKKEIAANKDVIVSLTREKHSLEVDLNRKISHLKSAEDKSKIYQEKHHEKEQEARRVTEEIGRVSEQTEWVKKRFSEVERKLEQERAAHQENREKLAVLKNQRDDFENSVKAINKERDELLKKLQLAENRATVAETVLSENKNSQQKYENEVKQLRVEKQDIKSSMEMEKNTRVEQEKKVAILMARIDAHEAKYKEMRTKLEHELEFSRNELAPIRQRMIKAEAGLERERNAVERLETKLAALSK